MLITKYSFTCVLKFGHLWARFASIKDCQLMFMCNTVNSESCWDNFFDFANDPATLSSMTEAPSIFAQAELGPGAIA